jgi:tetratricopeptide (TPR) repeat protein
MIQIGAQEVLDIPESIKMRTTTTYLLLIILVINACSKVGSPARSQTIKMQEADNRYEYYFVEGLRNKLLGSPAEAVSLFSECIELEPQRDGAYYQIALIAYMTGNLDEAEKYCSMALERNPELWYYSLMGDILHRKGKIEGAIGVYKDALQRFPDNEEIKFTLGRFYFDNGSFEEAVEIFRYFDSKYGIEGSSAIPLIKSLIELGKFNEAETKLTQLAEDYPGEYEYLGLLAELYRDSGQDQKAKEVYEILLRDNPDEIRIIFSLIEFLRKQGAYEDIFNLLNTVALKDAVSEEDKVNLFAAQLEDPQIIKDYVKEFEIPLMILEAAHDKSPVVKLLRAELYQHTGRINEAAQYLEAYVKTWPNSYYAWEKLLLILSDQRDNEKLYALSLTATRNFNTAILPKIMNAWAAIEIGLYDEALEQLERSKRLSNEDKDIVLQIVSLEADALYRKGDTQEAFSKFDEALKIDPGDNLILNKYSYFLAEKGMRLNEALRMIEKVIEVENNNTYNDTHAWVLYKMKKFRKAEIVMKKIIESNDNNNAEYFEHYGFILRERKKCGEAVISWTKAIEMDSTKTHLNREIEKCMGKN